MMKKKQLLCAVFALLLALCFALPAFAAPEVLIVDEMNKIGAQSMDKLEAYARETSDDYGMETAFYLTANDYAPQKLAAHAREYFSGIQDGFVLAHDIDAKLWCVVSFGKAQDIVTDDVEDQFWDAYDKEETYASGAMAYLRAARAFLKKADPTYTPGSNPTPDAPQVLRDPSEVSLLMDEAGLLSKTEAAALLARLEELSAKWKNDIVIVTVKSLGGNTPMEFADDWFDYNGYGQSASGDITDGNGVLLLDCPGSRDWYISTKGYAIQVFTDAGIEFIGDRLKADGLSDNKYAAYNSFADWCDKFYTQAEEGKPYDTGHMPQVKRTGADYAAVIVICLGGGFIIACIVVSRMKKQLKTVHMKAAAADYLRPGSLQVAYANDQFLYKNVTRVYNPPDSGSSSGGGSSSHSSSSGSSHGGGGGKY